MDGIISLIRLRAPIGYNEARELQRVHGEELEKIPDRAARLILLQHNPVFTLGRRTDATHLPLNESDLAARTGAEVLKSDRAGSITYHAPGQITAYLLLNLQTWKLDLHRHLDMLEQTGIEALNTLGIQGHREAGMTGVWVDVHGERKKICAIGVSARRWITYHGLSLNADIDLRPFDEIIPCGLKGKGVTSLTQVLGRSVDIANIENALSAAFAKVYQARIELGMV